MSLLLDALKKAAEQKAAKTKDEDSEAGTGSAEETVLDSASGETRDGDADDTSIPRHKLEDETELDHSEFDTRLEHMRTAREDRTGTDIDVPDETQLTSPHEQINSGEDETLVFAEDDVTDLTQGLPEDRTELTQHTSLEERTELTQRATREDETEYTQQPRDTEQTEFSEEPSVEQTEYTQRTSLGEETEFEQPVPDGGRSESSEETSVEQTEYTQDVTADKAAESKTEAGTDDTTGFDEDMSLLLVEREQTQLTSPTSITDPQRPLDALEALRRKAPSSGEDTRRSDTTFDRAGDNRTSTTDTARTRSSDTSTTSPASATRTTRATHTPGPDATSTHTYAPDNYDRTLMRLPSEDASRLFAGMKSDSDVVMTPDYAKQVFRSKSSAQRLQHYKFYTGIAVVILLGIGVYGVFEYQAQSDVLDTGLRPLKNDPMPGIIRPANGQQQAEPLFAEAEVNERALEIIQSIEGSESAGETQPTDEAAEHASAVEPAPAAAVDSAPAEQAAANPDQQASRQPAANPTGDQAVASGSMASSEVAVAAPADDTTISGTIASRTAASTGNSSSRLQIETGRRLEEKQKLLQEAYDAYRSGNDELALELYNKVLAIDPRNRNALLARAAIHVHNGNGSAAIEDYQTLLLVNPKDSLAMASLVSVANYSPLETESQLKLMIRDEPESPYLNFALANVYGAQNRWQEAQGHYYRALQNNPDDPNYAYNLAVSLEHISQPRAAVSYYRRALENYNKGLATFSKEVVDRRLEKLTRP